MKENIVYVTVVSSINSDGLTEEKMYIDNKFSLSVYPLCECPEDAIIERDLTSCFSVMGFMKKVVDWIEEGKEIIFNYRPVEDVNDFSIKEFLDTL